MNKSMIIDVRWPEGVDEIRNGVGYIVLNGHLEHPRDPFQTVKVELHIPYNDIEQRQSICKVLNK